MPSRRSFWATDLAMLAKLVASGLRSATAVAGGSSSFMGRKRGRNRILALPSRPRFHVVPDLAIEPGEELALVQYLRDVQIPPDRSNERTPIAGLDDHRQSLQRGGAAHRPDELD